MPALRQPLKRVRHWLLWIAAAVIAVAAIADWTRPPEKQASVSIYEHVVIMPYRALVRPGLAKVVHCRFVPTCSEYSVQAVRTFGFPKGAWLSVRRIFRCVPWVKPGTYDPVPIPS